MDLKLGHYTKDGIEVVDVEGEIDIYTAPRLREPLIDLASKNSCHQVHAIALIQVRNTVREPIEDLSRIPGHG